jgi:hypothetical protein
MKKNAQSYPALRRKSHRAAVVELRDVNQGMIPKKSPVYITWWFGPYSKLIGIQLGPFRCNLHYDRFDKMPDSFRRLGT